jgi:hypothetical protein
MERTRVCLIAGQGTAEASVIQAGLHDLQEDSHIVYVWDGKPSDGQAHVLDWLLVFKKGQFTVIHDGTSKIHSAVEGSAGEVLKANHLMVDAFDLYPKYTTLVLWDEHDGVPTPLTTEICTASLSRGMSTVDLCNGLVPLYLEEAPARMAPEAPRKPQDASKTPTPRETAPQPETPLKTNPNASGVMFVLSYVNEQGVLDSFTGSRDQIIKFVKTLS